jgi:ferredoxin/flavodoxin---NADP+ reductase
MLRYPESAPAAAAAAGSRFGELLTARGIRPVSYADWLQIEAAEKELAASLGRGARVKLPSRAELHRACGFAGRT